MISKAQNGPFILINMLCACLLQITGVSNFDLGSLKELTVCDNFPVALNEMHAYGAFPTIPSGNLGKE